MIFHLFDQHNNISTDIIFVIDVGSSIEKQLNNKADQSRKPHAVHVANAFSIIAGCLGNKLMPHLLLRCWFLKDKRNATRNIQRLQTQSKEFRHCQDFPTSRPTSKGVALVLLEFPSHVRMNTNTTKSHTSFLSRNHRSYLRNQLLITIKYYFQVKNKVEVFSLKISWHL